MSTAKKNISSKIVLQTYAHEIICIKVVYTKHQGQTLPNDNFQIKKNCYVSFRFSRNY